MSNRLSGISRTIAAIVLIIIIIVAGVLIYVYYASTQATSKLTVYALWSGTEEDNFKQVLSSFTADTGIDVDYFGQTTQDMLITVPQQLAAPPYDVDVMIVPWPNWIQDNSANLEPVTDLITVSQFPINIILSVSTPATIWAAPFKLSGKPGFWYRPSFFEANNLNVPTTYDEFKNTLLPAIQAVPGVEAAIASGVDANGLGWPLSDVAEAFIRGLGGYQLQLDLETGPSVRNWTDSQVTAVFDELTGLLEDGYFSTPAEWTGQIGKLWDGAYGLFFEGNFVTAQSQVQDTSDIDFFPFPETNGVSGAVDYITLAKEAPHMDQAKQLITYLASADAQEILVQQGGALATNTGVPASAYTASDKKVVDFMGEAGITIVPDLDDTIGGLWQTTFWDQLKLLFTDPSASTQTSVLDALQAQAIEQQGT